MITDYFYSDADECNASISVCDANASCQNTLDLIFVFVNLDLLEMEKSALVRCMHLIWCKPCCCWHQFDLNFPFLFRLWLSYVAKKNKHWPLTFSFSVYSFGQQWPFINYSWSSILPIIRARSSNCSYTLNCACSLGFVVSPLKANHVNKTYNMYEI